MTRLLGGGLVALRIWGGGTRTLISDGLGASQLTQVASLSKPVFAYSLLAELRQRRLTPEVTLGALAPGPYRHRQRAAVDLFDDPRAESLTVGQLLSHRGGLPNWSRGAPLSFVDEPGTRWRYSGEGYGLLQEVCERAFELTVDALVRRHVFGPCGMKRSTYAPTAKEVAEGHGPRGEVVRVTEDRAHAASSLRSSADEYARFVMLLLSVTPGSPAAALLDPVVTVDTERSIRWGLGLARSGDFFFHWGVNPGYRALVVGSMGRGQAVLVLSSSDAGMEPATDLVREEFGELPLLSFPMLFPQD